MHRRRSHLVIGVLLAACLSLPMIGRGAGEGRFLWEVWLSEDVLYIITPEEKDAFEQLTTDVEREQFVEQFWLRRDPTPATFANEFKQEHYRRLLYAQERFTGAKPGWKTDRGRLYIAWGPPDEIESHPERGGGSAPNELWRYISLEGAATVVVVKLSDQGRTGEYKVESFSEEPYDRQEKASDVWLPQPRPNFASGMEVTVKAAPFPRSQFPELEAYLTSRLRLDQIPFELKTSCTRATDATFIVSMSVVVEDSGIRARGSSEESASLQLAGRVRRSDGRIVESFDGEFFESPVYEDALFVAPGIHTIEVAIRDPRSGKISIHEELLDLTCQ